MDKVVGEIQKLQKKTKEQQGELQRMIEETAKEFAMTADELDRYSSNPANFSKKEWQTLEEERRKIRQMYRELGKILGINLNPILGQNNEEEAAIALLAAEKKKSDAFVPPKRPPKEKMSRAQWNRWKRSWLVG